MAQGIVDTAVKKVEAQGHSIKTVLVYDHMLAAKRETVAFTEGLDVWWQDVVPKQPTHCPVEWMGAEEPLFKVCLACKHEVNPPLCTPSTQDAVNNLACPLVKCQRVCTKVLARTALHST